MAIAKVTALSTRELEVINEAFDYWKEFEHDSWLLLNFTDRESAKFGWNQGGQYTKYVTLTRYQLKFMRGVQPDVFDYYAAS